jgi:hypothetical protein
MLFDGCHVRHELAGGLCYLLLRYSPWYEQPHDFGVLDKICDAINLS